MIVKVYEKHPRRNMFFLPNLSEIGGNIKQDAKKPRKYRDPKSPNFFLSLQCISNLVTQFWRLFSADQSISHRLTLPECPSHTSSTVQGVQTY
jgi:hypothetical protein